LEQDISDLNKSVESIRDRLKEASQKEDDSKAIDTLNQNLEHLTDQLAKNKGREASRLVYRE